MRFDPEAVEELLKQLARSLFTAVEIEVCRCHPSCAGVRIWWRDGSGNWV